VLAKSPANQDIEDLGSDFPEEEEDQDLLFSSHGAASRAELLALLPPGRYCDTLKDVYFNVFSPVCCQIFLSVQISDDPSADGSGIALPCPS